MHLDGYALVDVSTVYPYYLKNGLSLELLSKCNSQEFKYIDGYGKGYFLLTDDISSETVTFTVDSRVVELSILEKLSLEHPSFTGPRLILYVTAEPKYVLLKTTVGRNYNITIDKSLSPSGTPTITCLPPDQPPLTLEEILDDLLPFTLSYSADTLTPFDVNIEGLTALQAVDYLCSVYGLVWSFNGTTVYVWQILEASSNSFLPDPINDIRHSLITNEFPNIDISFPIFDYCRQDPSEYQTYSIESAGQGKTLSLLDPFYPAVVDSLGMLRNTALLTDRANLIADNFYGISTLIPYVSKHFHYAQPLSATPLSLSEVHGDWGDGPKSIYQELTYPVVTPIKPPCKDRYANNWVGTIANGYYGPVGAFIVSPAFGLDGKLPPGPQVVVNLYAWNYGEIGWYVRVEWDCVGHRWIALQQEYDCPPDEEPPPPEEPIEPYERPYPYTPEGSDIPL